MRGWLWRGDLKLDDAACCMAIGELRVGECIDVARRPSDRECNSVGWIVLL